MNFLAPITHWFQKRASAIGWAEVAREQQGRYNALLGADPDAIIRAVTAFDCGTLAPLARLIEAYERRDDKMMACSLKMKASVGRCDYTVIPREGFEDDPRAARHVEVLKRFWSGIETTSRFKMNERGGIGLLKKQMMNAQSYGFAVHELVWRPLPNGELGCTFIEIPLWHFENRTGVLRFLPETTAFDGLPMKDGEWMVTTGDGVGIAASICACLKRLTLADWAVFCQRCGMPIVVGKTGATYGSDQWNNLNAALRAIGRDARIQVDNTTDISAINVGGGSAQPYTPLVEWADRAIAALYRGADLSTMSQGGDGVGASLQGDEASMIEQDACNRLSETLQRQVERFVIRYTTGDEEPLAKIVIEPATRQNVDEDIRIDEHLVKLGARLSKNDALQRYGRVEAIEDEDALAAPQPQPGMGGFPNEKNFTTPAGQFKAAGQQSPGQDPGEDAGNVLAAFAKDTSPVADAIKALLKDPSKEAAKALLADLPTLLPDDPALAAVIAEEMAKQFTDPAGQKMAAGRHTDSQDSQALTNAARDTGYLASANVGLENAITNPCPKCHRQMSKDGHCKHCETIAANQKTVNGLIADLDLKGPDGKSKGWKDRTESLGDLDQKTIDDIKAANPNMNVESSVATVNTEQLQHSLNHHGNAEKESKRGQIAITKDDLKRIPEVLADYDRIDSGKGISEGKKQESVVFRKNYPDGTVACVELDVYSDKLKKRTLKFQTMWKEEN